MIKNGIIVDGILHELVKDTEEEKKEHDCRASKTCQKCSIKDMCFNMSLTNEICHCFFGEMYGHFKIKND